ncbi:hypothetical protein EMCG_04387 [[Emmonsia] crescens]|uniref:Uncharacterized protein n=1 Tax=[Emmonsia] crescens TaxID=73230 RepID=A0A0G2IYY0_9EURO|nr:hypothetical protein EMCG_04387 [Emmonsia crescens UAMH 3008]
MLHLGRVNLYHLGSRLFRHGLDQDRNRVLQLDVSRSFPLPPPTNNHWAHSTRTPSEYACPQAKSLSPIHNSSTDALLLNLPTCSASIPSPGPVPWTYRRTRSFCGLSPLTFIKASSFLPSRSSVSLTRNLRSSSPAVFNLQQNDKSAA